MLISFSILAQDEYKALIAKADVAYNEKNYAASAEFYKAADKLGGFTNANHAYNAACSASLAGKNGLSFKFLSKAIELGYTNKVWMEGDSDFDNLRKTGKYKKAIAEIDEAIVAYEASLKYPELRKELIEMQKEDQNYRKAAMDLMREKGNDNPEVRELWDATKSVDYKNTQRMKEIVKEYGWPMVSDVGSDGATAAWLIVQHADAQPHFQKQCLPLLEAAFKQEEAKGSNYAYLYDRVALKLGMKQRFGSQVRNKEFAPIENETEINERRAIYDLDKLEDYAKNFGFEYTVPDELTYHKKEKDERITAAEYRTAVKEALAIEDYDAAKEPISELTKMNGWLMPEDFYNKALIYLNISEPSLSTATNAIKLALVNGIDANKILDNPLMEKVKEADDWAIVEMMIDEMKSQN